VDWLRAKKVEAAVVRPDGFVYTAGDRSHPLPPPPPGLAPGAAPAGDLPMRHGVPA
jgi:3-(3-hydroxy-phenyl)propionate hydroxylase